MQSKLNNGNILINDNYIIYYTINSFPTEFTQIETVYNIIRVDWIVYDLITRCVVERRNRTFKDMMRSMMCKSNLVVFMR